MQMIDLMNGFPPAPEGQVTLGNWRKAPFNKWSFTHVREIVPSAEIAAGEHLRALPQVPVDFSSFSFRHGDRTYSLENFLDETDNDGFVVLHKGRIVVERYRDGIDEKTPHILMSVSKSVLGLLFGILVERGILDPGRVVTDIIPEVSQTAFAGATLRDLLDMRVGVDFDENYEARDGQIIAYRKAQNWDPLDPGEKPSDLRSFFKQLRRSHGVHGGNFHYVSPNTDLLGWAIERASGTRYADLLSTLLWQPMGAADPAFITVDRLGAPRCAGGVCTTTRDLARLGQLIADDGWRDGKQIIPTGWLHDILTADNRDAWDAGDLLHYYGNMPIHYRSKCYVLHGPSPLLFGLGVFGQNIFVDQKEKIVIVKFSSQPQALEADMMQLTMRAAQAIRDSLSN